MKIAFLTTGGLSISERGLHQLERIAADLLESGPGSNMDLELSLNGGSIRVTVTNTGARGSLITLSGPLFSLTTPVRKASFLLDDRYLSQPAAADTRRPGADKTRW